jgi:hypothetical protein
MKQIITGLLLSLMSAVGWGNSLSTLFIVAEQRSPAVENQYIAVASFPDRASCETSIKSENYLVAETLELTLTMKCLKTDESAGVFSLHHLGEDAFHTKLCNDL